MTNLRLDLTGDIDKALAGYAARKKLSKRSAATLLFVRKLAEETGDDSLQFTPPERGGWQGNEKSLQNLVSHVDRLTDKGRNDPAESSQQR